MKKHFYCFTFIENSGQVSYSSVYAAHDEQTVNQAQIAQAKQGANVSQESVLLSCSYLGHMTAEAFSG